MNGSNWLRPIQTYLLYWNCVFKVLRFNSHVSLIYQKEKKILMFLSFVILISHLPFSTFTPSNGFAHFDFFFFAKNIKKQFLFKEPGFSQWKILHFHYHHSQSTNFKSFIFYLFSFLLFMCFASIQLLLRVHV